MLQVLLYVDALLHLMTMEFFMENTSSVSVQSNFTEQPRNSRLSNPCDIATVLAKVYQPCLPFSFARQPGEFNLK